MKFFLKRTETLVPVRLLQLPSFLSLGILAFLRLYSLGTRDKYLPLKAIVEIKPYNFIRVGNVVDSKCYPSLGCYHLDGKDSSAVREELLS